MATKERPTKLGMQRRFMDVQRDAVNADARTVDVAFSSETPVERFWGMEILDHSPTSVNLGRMQDGGAVLVDHNPADHVGVVESVQIDGDRKGRAVLRFGKSQRAQEVWQDVVDGIRRHVSVGYVINRMALEKTGKDTPDEYRVTDWTPMEISMVAVPADPSAGVGRAEERVFDVEITSIIEERSMNDENKPAPTVDVQAVTNAARDAEITRAREILAAGALHHEPDMAAKAVSEGKSLDDFRSELLAKIAKGQTKVDAGVGMSAKEVREFSYLRVIRALISPSDRKAQEDAGFEREVSVAAAQKAGKAERGFVIPTDVLLAKRDLITGTGTGTAKGGNLIQTDVLGGSFIDVLRNAMVLPKVGARFMTGLQGNVAIPKRTTSVTAYWPGENTAPTEGANVFGQVTMSPKTLAAYIDIGRRLALQSSVDVEWLVRDDLTQTLAIAIDEAALGAAKTNGPTGLRGTSGIGSVAGATNGLAPSWANIVALEKAVEVANALTGSLAYVTNPKVRGKLKVTPKQSSGVEGNFLMGGDNMINGYPVVVSNQIPSNLTKGSASSVCSAIFFGAWGDLIVGQWGGIELIVDPMSLSTAGATRIVALVELDVCVRHAESFAATLDVLTT